VIDFGAVIARLGPRAVKYQLEEHERLDRKALAAVRDRSSEERAAAVQSWLGQYKVFMGFDTSQRKAISEAVIRWADARQTARLEGLAELVEAHTELAGRCRAAFGRERDFTSLASKALWLRYPDGVPLYDRLASQALTVVSRMVGEEPPAKGTPEYYQFAYTWQRIYERYRDAVEGIDARGYPYRVRIFDQVLWTLGEPGYGYSDGA
jgi:hypothetical protein